MADTVLEELLVSTEVQTARDRLEDYENAEVAANNNPRGEQELASLRDAAGRDAGRGPDAAGRHRPGRARTRRAAVRPRTDAEQIQQAQPPAVTGWLGCLGAA